MIFETDFNFANKLYFGSRLKKELKFQESYHRNNMVAGRGIH